MKRTIQVIVGNQALRIGTLHYDGIGSRERSAFAYGPTLSRWRQAGSALGMTAAELDQFADAFEHSERKSAGKAARQGR